MPVANLATQCPACNPGKYSIPDSCFMCGQRSNRLIATAHGLACWDCVLCCIDIIVRQAARGDQ